MSGDKQAIAPAEPGQRKPKLAPLHWSVRLVVLLAGSVLLLIGIAGLVLPGIQGILTIVLGLAVLSLASDFVHRQLRKLLVRWPKAHRMMERFRGRIHGWLSPGKSDPEN